LFDGPRKTMTGLEYMKQLQTGELAHFPMLELLNIRLAEVSE
jgi:hypothetical protein